MTTEQDTQFWREFIEIFRENPCLWDSKCDDYQDQSLKNVAYGLLLEKLWEIDVEADVDIVKKKIHVYKLKFGKEMSKLRKDSKYISTWCYFEQLKFLAQNKAGDESENSSTKDNMEQLNVEITSTCETRYQEPSAFSGSSSVGNNRMKRQLITDAGTNEDPVPSEKTRKVTSEDLVIEDECSALAKYVSVKMRSFDPMQRCIAQKLISDVIFLAGTKQLELSSSISIKRN